MQAAVPSTPLHFKVYPLYLQRIKKWVIRTSWPTEAALIPAQAAFSDSQTLGRKQKRGEKKQQSCSSSAGNFLLLKASVRGAWKDQLGVLWPGIPSLGRRPWQGSQDSVTLGCGVRSDGAVGVEDALSFGELHLRRRRAGPLLCPF